MDKIKDAEQTPPNTKKENPADEVAGWLAEIDAAMKREKDWRKEARNLVGIYEGQKKVEYQFNILYSNTETLSPALFNVTPRPVVQRRFKDEDPVGAEAAKAGQRILEYLLDDGSQRYTPFEELLGDAVLSALLPGRGVTEFRYDSEEKDGAVHDETVCGEVVQWDHFLHGYGRKWADVPWIAYYYQMTRAELIANFGDDIGGKVEVQEHEADGTDLDEKSSGRHAEDTQSVKTADVWKIWDKTSRQVIFISGGYKDKPLKKVDDPLQLTGFFPSPPPLRLFQRLGNLVPVPLYRLYEEQAKELNRLTVRINKVINAMKVRGFYDSQAGETLSKLLEQDDNVLLPAENAALATSGGLDRLIWLMPLEKLVTVVQQLYVQRSQCKQVIYEITGVSDILRGASVASETATAQEIKNQWGTLRLKRMQRIVSRYARDCLRIMLEIAVSKLSQETIQKMTGLPYPTQMQKQQAQMVAQQVQAQAAETGQQPPPEQAQQFQQFMQQPDWESILEMLRNDLSRSYRVDIETNSTVDVEATEDKQNVSELLNAISQFMTGIAPMIEKGVMPFEAASAMLLAVVRRFRFGAELEDKLKEMKAPPPPAEDPADKMKMQLLQKETEGKMAVMDKQLQIKQQELQLKQQELEMKREELELKRQDMMLQQQMKDMDMRRQMAMKTAGIGPGAAPAAKSPQRPGKPS